MANKQLNKTKPTSQRVEDFLTSITEEEQRQDSQTLVTLMAELTGEPPTMWGPSIVGFGQYHYKYASGREGDAAAVGFAPRKGKLTIYCMEGTSRHEDLLRKLGPHQLGKGCLYIKRLSDVDLKVLREIISKSYKYVMQHKVAMHRAT